jgi:Cu-Zn family superoxide dismutase
MYPVRFTFAVVVVLSGCSMYGSSTIERADVPVRDAAGRDVGTLSLAPHTGGLVLTGTVRGLPPGAHGIHLHASGRCEPPFESAGAHWNPTRRLHGTANPQGPHLGDMPNLVVAGDGTGTVSVMTPGGTLSGADALLDADGAAVVIHAGPDDYRTDPSGNSGERIACGVVRGR